MPTWARKHAYNLSVEQPAALLDALGGESGCRRLSANFYARVGTDPVLRPLFPGKSLRCAIEEFAAFLIQFLGGDEQQTQHRWWLSLRESHARFRIGPAERQAWLRQMSATLDAASLDPSTRSALQQFFGYSSAYVAGAESGEPEQSELAVRWREQRLLDDAVAAINGLRDAEAVALCEHFAARPAVFAGLLARMIQTGRSVLIDFAVRAAECDPSLATRRSGGRTLLHYAAGAGCLPVVAALLRVGADPEVRDAGGHTPLYRAANECASDAGPQIVKALVRAGADGNTRSGVTRATPLHMAARRGFVEIARTLLDCGAAIDVRDSKGDTPLQRATNCRRAAVVQLLKEYGRPGGAGAAIS